MPYEEARAIFLVCMDLVSYCSITKQVASEVPEDWVHSKGFNQNQWVQVVSNCIWKVFFCGPAMHPVDSSTLLMLQSWEKAV